MKQQHQQHCYKTTLHSSNNIMIIIIISSSNSGSSSSTKSSSRSITNSSNVISKLTNSASSSNSNGYIFVKYYKIKRFAKSITSTFVVVTIVMLLQSNLPTYKKFILPVQWNYKNHYVLPAN